MAKYCGLIGFAKTMEDENHPGVWRDTVVERRYFGDYMNDISSQWRGGSSVNDDFVVSAQISILSDPFARDNFGRIKYAELFGVLWKVTGAKVEYPRIKLTLGGEYNGESPRTSA